jgi:uncharacterized protein (TIGR03435 family)
MRAAILNNSVLLFVSAALLAQSGQPSFDVASVRMASPGEDGGNVIQGGPGSSSPERLTANNITLQNVLLRAYGLKTGQLAGPDWLRSARFDIMATVAPGTTPEQVNVMLQNLIVERFHFTFHRQKKVLPVYELTVGKNGPKLTASAGDPKAPPAPPGTRGTIDKNGFPVLPAGRGPAVGVQVGCDGNHVTARAQTASAIADLVEAGVDSRVVDKTGLTGTYDLMLRFKPLHPTICQAADGTAPSILNAVEQQLGLKLEKSKDELDVLVVDHLDKTPADN